MDPCPGPAAVRGLVQGENCLRETSNRGEQRSGVSVTMKEATEVSVVIPAYNEVRAIGECLESLLATLGEARFSHEVIVVDDGSSDGTAFYEGIIRDALWRG